jgi:hypothetical protein
LVVLPAARAPEAAQVESSATISKRERRRDMAVENPEMMMMAFASRLG